MIEPSAFQPVRALRLGELDTGAVAIGGRGGVVQPVDHRGTMVSWWVGAEDRWHIPAAEPSSTDRVSGVGPILETVVRIPSGVLTGAATVARIDGEPGPSMVFDLENSSPIPVAICYLVESEHPLAVGSNGITVSGVGRLRLTRPAMGYVVADSLAEARRAVESGDIEVEPPAWDRPGVGVVFVPLPHTAHSVAAFTQDDHVETPANPAVLDRECVPPPTRIAAGWSAHLERAPRVVTSDQRYGEMVSRSIGDVLLGGDPATSPSANARVIEALGRLGQVGDLGPLWEQLDSQHRTGRVVADDPVGATCDLLRTMAAWWSGGLDLERAEPLVGPSAQAGHWLGRSSSNRRTRSSVAGREAEVAGALRSVIPMLADLGQPEVAEDLARFAEELEQSVPPRPELAADTASLVAQFAGFGEGLAWGVDGAPDVGGSAAFVVESLDAMVRESVAGLDLIPAWTSAQAGEPIELHNCPTRWGRLSFAVRWHGRRPALLWELTVWPDRSVADPVRLTASAIDPTWSTDQLVGETLLAEPVGLGPTIDEIAIIEARDDAPTRARRPEPPISEGQSFS